MESSAEKCGEVDKVVYDVIKLRYNSIGSWGFSLNFSSFSLFIYFYFVRGRNAGAQQMK